MNKTISIQPISTLNFDLPQDLAECVRDVNRAIRHGMVANIADAQAAIQAYADALDSELTDSGHFARGQLSEIELHDTEERLRKDLHLLRDAIPANDGEG